MKQNKTENISEIFLSFPSNNIGIIETYKDNFNKLNEIISPEYLNK